MAAPTRVAGSQVSSFSTSTTPKASGSLTLSVGDILVVAAGAGGPSSGMGTNPTVSAGAVTWTLQKSVAVAGFGDIKLWTGSVTTGGTATVSVTATGGQNWGFIVEQYANGAVVGTSVVNHASTGNATISITPTVANAAIVSVGTDFNGTTGTITWATVNGSAETAQATYQGASDYGYYGGYVPDAGTAAAKTVGVTAPTGQVWAIAAVEIQGSSSTNYNYTPADNEGLTDSLGTTNDAVRSQADPLGFTDALGTALDAVRSQADALGLTDTFATALDAVRSPAEPLGFTDALGTVNAAVRSQADAEALTDALTAAFDFVRSNSDALGFSDALAKQLDQGRSQADPLGLTDSLGTINAAVRQQDDPLGFTDVLTAIWDRSTTLADALGLTDVANKGTALTASLADALGFTDAATTTNDAVRSQLDALGFTDSTSSVYAFVRSVLDALGLADALASNADAQRPQNDAAGLADTLTATADRSRTQADGLGFSDSLTASYDRVVSISDALGFVDALQKTATLLRDAALAGVPLPVRWSVASALARWAASWNSRWTTIALDGRWSLEGEIERFTSTLTPGDTMTTDVIISAGAVKYVGGTITEITGKDITGATFQISLGSDIQPGAWLTPDVSTVGATNNVRTVKLLVSSSVPAGLAKGTYWAWVRISDSPEVEPLRVQGPINVR